MTLKLIALAAAVLCAGCAGSGSELTTASLFGGEKKPAPPPVNDPTSRAYQVGAVSARAVKCGYNFDPAALRQKFLAAEAAQGLQIADLAKVEKTYDVAFNGVTKAVASAPNYCTERKTTEIKTDLTRHLAGDYTPAPRKVAEGESTGPTLGLDVMDLLE